MTYTLDLTHDEMRRVRAAEARGVSVAALVKGLIGALPETNPVTPEPRAVADEDATIAFLQARLDEYDRMTDAERGDAEKELADFKRNINEERKRAGMRLMYPEE
jgi:hypothetical protein